jgi:hypothetical protein
MLGRVVMADIAATLVDLCARDFLQLEKVPGADGGDDWSLRPRPALAGHAGVALLGYEETLLKGLARQGEDCRVSWLPSQAAHLLDATRSAIVHESVHRGWLRHLDHKQTDEGEEFTRKARSFQRQVRHFISEASGNSPAVPGELLPYALRFGLMASDDAPLVQFAHAWVVAFADLPGWQAPQPPKAVYAPDYGPLLNDDDHMSRQIAMVAFQLGM